MILITMITYPSIKSAQPYGVSQIISTFLVLLFSQLHLAVLGVKIFGGAGAFLQIALLSLPSISCGLLMQAMI